MDPDPDPTPDPTSFFSDLKDAKQNFLIFCFLYLSYLPYLQSFFNFLPKVCVRILFCKHYFSLLNTFMRKGKDPEPDQDPYF
jgi:hypothetical protein